jgi:predicted acylesterase/phospholipase RssA
MHDFHAALTDYCRFVCAVPAKNVKGAPRLFRTWLADKNPGYNCTIWEAARATSAAPRIFERISIEDAGVKEEFVDAGLGCNNPIRYLVQEARQEFGLERHVSCILSIGMGKRKVAEFKKPSLGQRAVPTKLIRVLASMATDTEAEADAMASRYQQCTNLYHRLNVDDGLDEISLEEWEALGDVKTHTHAYLRQMKTSHEIDTIVKALLGNADETFPLKKLGT